jgi:hypothetical protein
MFAGWSGWKIAGAIVLIACAIAIVYAALTHLGIAIPPIIVTVFLIVLVGVVCLIGLAILAGFWNRLP